MNKANHLLKEAEELKIDLASIIDIYDEVFGQWILVMEETENDRISRNNNHCGSTDVNVLCRFQKVLTAASTLKTKMQEEHERKLKQIRKMKEPKIFKSVIVGENSKNSQSEISGSTAILSSSRTVNNSSSLATNATAPFSRKKYLPAHVSAPFRTDPNLHNKRPRSKSFSQHCKPQNSINTSFQTSIIKCNPSPSSNNDSAVNVTKLSDNTHGVDSDDVKHVLTELKCEIERLHKEQIEPAPVRKPRLQSVSVEEAGDKWTVQSTVRLDCVAYFKTLSHLSRLVLLETNPEPQSIGIRARRAFLDSFGETCPVTQDICSLRQLTAGLERLENYIALMDLESCSVIQIGFLRSCFTLFLMDFLKFEPYDNSDRLKNAAHFPHSSESHTIQNWLSNRQKVTNKSLYDDCIEMNWVTNCPFVAIKSSKFNPVQSVSVSIPSSLPFRFGRNKLKLKTNLLKSELEIRKTIVRQQMQFCWATKLKEWTDELHRKYKQKDNPSSYYRNLHGLLLGKFPVILMDDDIN